MCRQPTFLQAASACRPQRIPARAALWRVFVEGEELGFGRGYLQSRRASLAVAPLDLRSGGSDHEGIAGHQMASSPLGSRAGVCYM
jgi:hypothetical protein